MTAEGQYRAFEGTALLDAVRTPWVDLNGPFGLVSPTDLGIKAGCGVLQRALTGAEVESVIQTVENLARRYHISRAVVDAPQRLAGRCPLAWLRASSVVGVAPQVMGIGPVPAIRLLFQRAELALDGIGHFEINEAQGRFLRCSVRWTSPGPTERPWRGNRGRPPANAMAWPLPVSAVVSAWHCCSKTHSRAPSQDLLMSSYRTPLTEMAFVIEQWLDAPAYWAASPHFSHVDFELGRQVLEEGARFAEEQLLPLRASGDRQGCTFQSGEAGNDGRVTTPEGFALAYARYVEAGWPGLACDMADGGHGLPLLLSVALHEAIFACNHAWAMYTGITQGAYECLRRFATPALRQAWLGKIVSGECLTTMCLTEPQAGSDLGLLRCHASASADGTYRLDGNKIFISGGDHDFTRQIVHLVLARLPDAPLGSRGISMFLVPKLDDQGEPNGVHCTGIEHKMGIRASATCSISFHNARGWLIGAPHGGLTAMFAMMNSARAYVGVQGLAHAHAAEQQALAYAEERVQMRAITRPAQLAQAPADPIASHPAVRHVLLECRALGEGMRVLAYWCAHLVDQARGGEPAQRQPLEARAQLLTPLIKAFCTEQGFSLTSQALQVFGGYGYMTEQGIEQRLRDSRVAMIYEGTNELQANDLLVRKVLDRERGGFADLLVFIRDEATQASDGLPGQWATRIKAACLDLQVWVEGVPEGEDAEYPYCAAGDFLQALAILLLGHVWLRTVRLVANSPTSQASRRKHQTAEYFFAYLWPRFDYRLQRLNAAAGPLPFAS